MKILRNKQPSETNTAITIGNFDGLHLGHQKLIHNLITYANQHQLTPTIVSFEPLPREYFQKNPPKRIMYFRDKVHKLATLGIKQFCCLYFNQTLAELNADQFIKSILVNQLKTKHIITGQDFYFAKNRQGNHTALKQASKQHNFTVELINDITDNQLKISSTKIRQALNTGNLEEAAKWLGRPYTLTGKVTHGQQLGQKIGTPTANIKLKSPPALTGVYTVTITKTKEPTTPKPAIANIGTRPTFNNSYHQLEIHLLNHTENLYAQELTVTFHHKIRDEQKFPSIEALTHQINKDKETAKNYFKQSQYTKRNNT